MQQKNTFQFILPYAIALFGIRLIIDILVKQLGLGYTGESYGGFISFAIEIGFIFFTTFKYKKWLNGEMKFSEGVKIGVGLMLLVGIFFSMYLYIHNQFIDPTYQERLVAEANALMKANMPEIDTTALEGKQPNAALGFGMSIIKYIFIGAFGGIVSAAILKTEK